MPLMARGSSNANVRGSAASRRIRRQQLLDTFGDGVKAPCYRCGLPLDMVTLTVDRIFPGCLGGQYVLKNCRPCCAHCNESTGGALGHVVRGQRRMPLSLTALADLVAEYSEVLGNRETAAQAVARRFDELHPGRPMPSGRTIAAAINRRKER